MCHVLRAGAQMEHRNNLRERVDGQPEPQHLCGAAQPCAQFIQLQVWEVQMAEEALVHGLRVLASAENPFGSRRIQPFGQRREHHGYLVRGGFQTVQGRVAPGSERGAAGLTTKRLDALGTAMLAISDEGVDPIIGDAEVRALLVRTGEACGVHTLGDSPPAFHLWPGTHRSRRWSSN